MQYSRGTRRLKFQFSLNNTKEWKKEVLCLGDWRGRSMRVYVEISVNNAFFSLD